MNYEESVYFHSSEEIFPKAKELFLKYEKKIKEILPADNEILQIGSSSVPGMIGKEDVDIQIRVAKEDFDVCEKALRENFQTKHEQNWKEHSAIFTDDEIWQIDIILTVAGSDRDHYYIVKEALMADSKKVEEFNELKKSFEGKPYGEYRLAKKDFIEKILGRK